MYDYRLTVYVYLSCAGGLDSKGQGNFERGKVGPRRVERSKRRKGKEIK